MWLVYRAEPMKKRKKEDIGIKLDRLSKRQKMIEKAIKKAQSKGRRLKPIDEISGFAFDRTIRFDSNDSVKYCQ